MNLFYFNIDQFSCRSSDQWLGLCRIRILQILSRHKRVAENELIDYLAGVFEYPIGYVRSCVKDLRAFGMVDSSLSEIYIKESHQVSIKSIVLSVSKKGCFILEETFSNIDFMYYFAIDSALPKNIIELGLVKTHSNKLLCRTNYPLSAITTSITFLLFLSVVNNEEAKKAKKNKESFEVNFLEKIELPTNEASTLTGFTRGLSSLIDNADSDSLEGLALSMKQFLLLEAATKPASVSANYDFSPP